jgi:hypothetical protein
MGVKVINNETINNNPSKKVFSIISINVSASATAEI